MNVWSAARPTQSKVLFGGCTIIEKTWKVYLVEYDGAGTDDLLTLADRMVALFQGSSYAVTYAMDGTARLQDASKSFNNPALFLGAGATDIDGQIADDGSLLVDGGSSCS